MIRNAPPIVHVTKKSGNVKTGPIPVSSSALGATTSDAQAVADAEMEKLCSWGWAKN
jgi:hypothetical protein